MEDNGTDSSMGEKSDSTAFLYPATMSFKSEG